MNHVQRFREGDRVSTKYPIFGLPAGTCGTIQSVFISVNGAYDVLFEDIHTQRIVFQPDLNPVAAVATGGCQRR